MKRMLSWILVLTLLLSGCAGNKTNEQDGATDTVPTTAAEPSTENADETTQAATEAPTEVTTAPTEPQVYRNPLNGEILDTPFTGRVYASTISNMQENMPHVGVPHADVVMEMYVNMNNITRCLALFTDIDSAEAVGSTRSTRPIFNDIAQHYDLVLSHAGGSSTALSDADDRGIDHFNVDSWEVYETGASYRDKQYRRSLENSLFVNGPVFRSYAEAKGVAPELEKDYGFRFTEDGTPAEGEAADTISWTMVYKQAKKDTSFVYNADLDKYVWNQYGKEMHDQITDEPEAFTNVLIMFANITNNGIYHAADFTAGGTGYYANGGKLIPIVWACDDEDSAFRFMTNDAQDLEMGVGNTYIAIVTPESPVTWEGIEQPASVQETVAYSETPAGENG